DGWLPDRWHHVAAVWDGLAGADGELMLYVDGELAGSVAGLDLAADQPGPRLDLGRDSDATPDYADALMDDVFLYSRALTAEEIAQAVRAARGGRLATPITAVLQARDVEGWLSMEHPYRAVVQTAPTETERADAWFELPVDFTADLRALGESARAAQDGYRLFEVTDGARWEVGYSLADGQLMWPATGVTPAGESRTFEIYFDALRYRHARPLRVAREVAYANAPTDARTPPPDYASNAYDDAWDFDEGDTEAIDRFGDKDEFWADIRVTDGALRARVNDDPYIIWGSMWGAEDAGERQVRIDVDTYHTLVMRVRQSVPAAGWVLFGRPVGSDALMRHEFTVQGQGWQTIRIDLVEDAGWGGEISAFRIDTTEDVEAEIAIDWVRLLSISRASRQPVEARGEPTSVPATVVAALDEPSPIAGAEQTLTISVTDAAGEPVGRQPVRVSLVRGSGGSLSPGETPALDTGSGLRGITDDAGKLAITYAASAKAGESADTIIAATEFPTIQAETVTVDTRAGPPDHYLVHSPKISIHPEADMPLDLAVHLVDAHDNPVPGEAELHWEVADATLRDASTATGADGAARATLVPDMRERWVYTVRVKDDQGRSGESGPICILPEGPRPNPVSLGGSGYFATADGEPYVPLGGCYINWVGLPDAETGEEGRILRSFTDCTEDEILHWLDFLRRQGVNTLRFMLRTHVDGDLEGMDVGGRVNRPLFAKSLRLMDLARRFDIRFLLVIHDDYDKPVYCNRDKLRKFGLPRFAGEDLDA
ncbi:MAG TPA: LamG-like jellyroll fold domain-containing protein, partial [Armatimonadota bacterium]|nr:LamG-like jellyroll fold domain-containing protein [Armatimonadota bacterium]